MQSLDSSDHYQLSNKCFHETQTLNGDDNDEYSGLLIEICKAEQDCFPVPEKGRNVS